MKCHLTMVSMAMIKNYTKNKCWRRCGERNLVHCWWECKLVQPLWGIVWRFLKKTKTRTITWSYNPTPGHIPEENHNLKRCMYPNFHCSIIYNSHDMEATWMSMDRGIDKEEVVHKYNGILLSHKKWNNVIYSNIDGRHSEGSQRWILHDIAYSWNLKKFVQMNLFTKQK